MRTVLRLGALALVVLSLALWFFGGPNLGWTKTSVPIPKTDPITQQQYQEWEKRFVPGVDFLGAIFLVAGLLVGMSFLCGSATGGRSSETPAGGPRS